MTEVKTTPKVLGITGGIASGKSALARLFKEWGAELIDADQIARQVMAPGTSALQQIVTIFGPQYLLADGSLNRAKLGRLVFSDPQALLRLNQITQKAIRQQIGQAITTSKTRKVKLIVAEIPLLVEEGYQPLCDGILVADLPVALQLERIQQRDGLTATAAAQRIEAQASQAARLAVADFVVDTSQDLAQLKRRFQALVQSDSFQAWLNA
ncbi:dephospho-CoA kinase [Lapidilactobacillus luobeiensis]|uniref:dephospho-CoA kinase n=1 Tax=Lapidilactobacillus luobeiensis TaxID=2950371 RepID=UPI0021C29B7C|nr:dephospho-CoA kinase [Lapidilactobacillus luobeiensis]